MKKFWSHIAVLSLGLLLSNPGALHGNPDRSITASGSVSELRPQGQMRIWTFTHKGQDIGHLITQTIGAERINGRQAIVISDSLLVDYQKIGSGATLSFWGKQYVSSVGAYLGSDLTLLGENGTEELSLRLESDPNRKMITGYFTRAGRKLNRSLPISRDMFGWDVHLLDQLELWLAMQSFSVGDTLQDTLFSARTLLTVPVMGVVDKFIYRELYRGKHDSVFVIEMLRPQPLQLTFSPRKELVRVDFKSQEIRAYLDFVGSPTANQSVKKAVSPDLSLGTIVRWLFLLAIGLLTFLLLASKGRKSIETWLGLVIGGAVCALLLFLMTPLQSWLVDNLFSGDPADSGKIYWLWLIPTVVLALAQESFKAGSIYLTLLWRNPKEYLFTSVGAALGVGFGLVETGYQSQSFVISSILDWSMVGQMFTILFHAVTGNLVGWAILKSGRTILGVVGLALAVNVLIHYLPSFVVNGLFEQPVVYLATALISSIFLIVALMIQRRSS